MNEPLSMNDLAFTRFKADRIVPNETMAGFRFIRMQIIMFRSNSKFAFVRRCPISHASVINHDRWSRITARAFTGAVDRSCPPHLPHVRITTAAVKRQKSRDENKISSGIVRRFHSRIMLFSCFRRMIVFFKYRSASRERA